MAGAGWGDRFGSREVAAHGIAVVAFTARVGSDSALRGETLRTSLDFRADGVAPASDFADVSLNGPVTAMPDVVTLTRSGPATIAVLALVAVGQPGKGTSEIAGHTILYTPDAGGAGTDTFTNTVQDGEFSAVGSVSVTLPAMVLYLPVMRR